MKVLDSLNQVAEFHRIFKHPVLKEPKIPSKKRCELRVSLIREELEELAAAIKEAEATVKHYQVNKGMDCYYQEADGHFLVYRKEDNKTLKSINYSPADLKSILER